LFHEAPPDVELAVAAPKENHLRLDFSLKAMSVLTMATNLDEDVRALKAEIRGAWRRLADPALTSFDRREQLHEGSRIGVERRSQAHRR
jgi:hypothetical protein